MEIGTWNHVVGSTESWLGVLTFGAAVWLSAKAKVQAVQAGWTKQTRCTVTLWGWAVGWTAFVGFAVLGVAQLVLAFWGVSLFDVFVDGVSFFEAAFNGEVHHNDDLHGQLPCVPE